MVITTWLHMFRVVLTGSYKRHASLTGRRRGVAGLDASAFVYRLPAADDQLGFWAVTVGTNMARATPMFGSEVPLAFSLE